MRSYFRGNTQGSQLFGCFSRQGGLGDDIAGGHGDFLQPDDVGALRKADRVATHADGWNGDPRFVEVGFTQGR